MRIAGLAELLGEPYTFIRSHTGVACDKVAGWGRRAPSERARRYAEQHGLPFLVLEDGFLRSVGLGSTDQPLSLVVDDLGIYYDAAAPSRLEMLVKEPHSQAERLRARQVADAWRTARVSKYNHTREYAGTIGTAAGHRQKYVLAVDQTLGDASIRCGGADATSFQRMLQGALEGNPDCLVVLKVHPEVMAGRKQGHFDLRQLMAHPRIVILAEDVHPVSLIERAEAVYVVTSQMGFEGLLWGKPVYTFGMPFYAGWGLTTDALAAPERRRPVSFEDLVYAALIAYTRYIDPETGQRCEMERVIEWMGLQRRMRARFPGELYALGFSRWKKPIVQDFFQGSTVRFIKRAGAVPTGATVIRWGRKPGEQPLGDVAACIRIEDGFLRSVGLGAELVRPLSWVIDTDGIYYDATCPSRLENLLQHTAFDAALRDRAAALRQAICTSGVTKYNVGADAWKRPAGRQRVILVPGQVETDASIRYGAAEIRRNIDLLRAVRERNPDAYVIYKPHPDVRAALRRAGEGEDQAQSWCDEVIGNVRFDQLLTEVDEVHVLTSLAGFEALMRGKRVTCYGWPFYAGWGLTEDIVKPPRRNRKLELDELVAATLILYPSYVSRRTRKFTTPERALHELLSWRAEDPIRRPIWHRLFARIFRKK